MTLLAYAINLAITAAVGVLIGFLLGYHKERKDHEAHIDALSKALEECRNEAKP